MPTFNFNTISKPTKTKTSNKIEKNVKGVIGIRLDGTYYVLYKGFKYPITKSSYSCKGKEIIYKQQGYNNIDKVLSVVRLEHQRTECNHKHWLPFIAGKIAIGDVIGLANGEHFDIKNVDTDYSNKDAKILFKFYCDNHEEIERNINEFSSDY